METSKRKRKECVQRESRKPITTHHHLPTHVPFTYSITRTNATLFYIRQILPFRPIHAINVQTRPRTASLANVKPAVIR